MRDRSQQQSPSEAVAGLYDLVLHPAQTFFYRWTLACFPRCAWSTPATNYADAVIAASSALAQTFFRVVVRFAPQSPGAEFLSRRYMPMVPSVTGREEKSAVTLHPRRAD
jgi:hypothetical protein